MTDERPVLYVLKRFPRLSETFILREILELERQGVRVAISALLPPEPGPCHPELEQLRAAVRYVPRHPRLAAPQVALAHLIVASRRPRCWWRTARDARREGSWRRFLQAGVVAQQALGVSHVHAHFATAAAEVARMASAMAGVPFTVTAHAKDIFQVSNESVLRRRLAGAAAVVTVSRYNVDHLTRTLSGTPVHYVPNGAAVAPLAPRQSNGPLLCVARLVPKKGVDTLIRALAITGPAGPDLEIIGGGALADDLQKLAIDLGLDHRVRLLGAQPSPVVDDAYARCFAVALACRIAEDGDRDGLPTVLLEAMARGRPVISTGVIGIPELVRHESTGLLVPPDDPQALAEAILRLWRDPALATRLADGGRHLVSQDYDPPTSAAKLRAVFIASRVGNVPVLQPS